MDSQLRLDVGDLKLGGRRFAPADSLDEGDGVGGDGGTGIEHFDLFEPDPTPMEDL